MDVGVAARFVAAGELLLASEERDVDPVFDVHFLAHGRMYDARAVFSFRLGVELCECRPGERQQGRKGEKESERQH